MRRYYTGGPRKSLRLRNFDYSENGAYFLTMVATGRRCLFGRIKGGCVHLNLAGKIVAAHWERTAEIRSEIQLDAWIVMPNHVHAVVFIKGCDTATDEGDQPVAPTSARLTSKSLGSLVAGFKSAVTTCINLLRNTPGAPVWQRNFYDRVIRTEAELRRIREYISANPFRWADDPENPGNDA